MPRIAPTTPVQQRQPRFRDPAYLKSANGRECDVCRAVGTTVFAHMRAGNEGGMGLKPSDMLGSFLCFDCHTEQESQPGLEWWGENVLKPLMIERYGKWRMGNDS